MVRILAAAFAALFLASAVPARAGAIIEFDRQNGIDIAPAARLTIEQVDANTVGFRFDNLADDPYNSTAFISKLRLNYTGNGSINALLGSAAFWDIDLEDGFSFEPFSKSDFGKANGNVAGYHGFDIELRFGTAKHGRLLDHETYAWTFTLEGLTVDDFLVPIEALMKDSALGLIHVHGIEGPYGESSYWITGSYAGVTTPDIPEFPDPPAPPASVPEPSSALSFLTGLILLGFVLVLSGPGCLRFFSKAGMGARPSKT